MAKILKILDDTLFPSQTHLSPSPTHIPDPTPKSLGNFTELVYKQLFSPFYHLLILKTLIVLQLPNIRNTRGRRYNVSKNTRIILRTPLIIALGLNLLHLSQLYLHSYSLNSTLFSQDSYHYYHAQLLSYIPFQFTKMVSLQTVFFNFYLIMCLDDLIQSLLNNLESGSVNLIPIDESGDTMIRWTQDCPTIFEWSILFSGVQDIKNIEVITIVWWQCLHLLGFNLLGLKKSWMKYRLFPSIIGVGGSLIHFAFCGLKYNYPLVISLARLPDAFFSILVMIITINHLISFLSVSNDSRNNFLHNHVFRRNSALHPLFNIRTYDTLPSALLRIISHHRSSNILNNGYMNELEEVKLTNPIQTSISNINGFSNKESQNDNNNNNNLNENINNNLFHYMLNSTNNHIDQNNRRLPIRNSIVKVWIKVASISFNIIKEFTKKFMKSKFSKEEELDKINGKQNRKALWVELMKKKAAEISNTPEDELIYNRFRKSLNYNNDNNDNRSLTTEEKIKKKLESIEMKMFDKELDFEDDEYKNLTPTDSECSSITESDIDSEDKYQELVMLYKDAFFDENNNNYESTKSRNVILTRNRLINLSENSIKNSPIRQFNQEISSSVTNSPTKSSLNELNTGACVVCHTSARCIILKPCCCLALCDDCREMMATKNFKDCPCCRTSVSGYSKLFVP